MIVYQALRKLIYNKSLSIYCFILLFSLSIFLFTINLSFITINFPFFKALLFFLLLAFLIESFLVLTSGIRRIFPTFYVLLFNLLLRKIISNNFFNLSNFFFCPFIKIYKSLTFNTLLGYIVSTFR